MTYQAYSIIHRKVIIQTSSLANMDRIIREAELSRMLIIISKRS